MQWRTEKKNGSFHSVRWGSEYIFYAMSSSQSAKANSFFFLSSLEFEWKMLLMFIVHEFCMQFSKWKLITNKNIASIVVCVFFYLFIVVHFLFFSWQVWTRLWIVWKQRRTQSFISYSTVLTYGTWAIVILPSSSRRLTANVSSFGRVSRWR